jgi:hypothetical protein
MERLSLEYTDSPSLVHSLAKSVPCPHHRPDQDPDAIPFGYLIDATPPRQRDAGVA